MTKELIIWFIVIATILIMCFLLNKNMPKEAKQKIEGILKYKWYFGASLILGCIYLIIRVPFSKARGISRESWVTFWGSIIGCIFGGIIGGIIRTK